MPASADGIDLEDILVNERVVAHFQPWVSLKKRSIVGFEGLCRGMRANSKELISPMILLAMAEEMDLVRPLDSLFRKKVLERFHSPIAKENPDLVLSINFDTSVLDRDEKSLDDFIATVKRLQAEALAHRHRDSGKQERQSCPLEAVHREPAQAGCPDRPG
jgi:EAL domain-containing protein (putative c-di-GMP-specific phosphodiesterase class I)